MGVPFFLEIYAARETDVAICAATNSTTSIQFWIAVTAEGAMLSTRTQHPQMQWWVAHSRAPDIWDKATNLAVESFNKKYHQHGLWTSDRRRKNLLSAPPAREVHLTVIANATSTASSWVCVPLIVDIHQCL